MKTVVGINNYAVLLFRLRQPGPDDLRVDVSRWQDYRSGGGAWHGDPALSHASAGQGDQHQPDWFVHALFNLQPKFSVTSNLF